MKNKPTISIIIPTYNRAAIISKTIDSFIAQTYEDWEMIVVDDHSNDNTKEIIGDYHEHDSRINYLLNERKKGAQGARNTGILHAQADWIICFDSDNAAKPNMLSSLVAAMNENVDVVTCFSNVIDVTSQKQIETFTWINEGNIHQDLLVWKCYVDFNQAIIRKRKLLEIGLLDEDCPSMQEWDTHIRLSTISKYTTVKEYMVDYYVGARDAISSSKEREARGYLYLFSKHQEEWLNDKEALEYMLLKMYGRIREVHNYTFRVRSLWQISLITRRILCVMIRSRFKYLKRKIGLKNE